MAEYGPNEALVREVIDYVDHGELFQPKGPLPSGPFVLVEDLEQAMGLAWEEPPSAGGRPWREIRELEMSQVLRLRYEQEDFSKADESLVQLLDPFGLKLRRRLIGTPYTELLDDVAADMADMYNAAWNRAVNGSMDNVLERIFQAYALGTWPCGWSGRYPEGSMAVYLPS